MPSAKPSQPIRRCSIRTDCGSEFKALGSGVRVRMLLSLTHEFEAIPTATSASLEGLLPGHADGPYSLRRKRRSRPMWTERNRQSWQICFSRGTTAHPFSCCRTCGTHGAHASSLLRVHLNCCPYARARGARQFQRAVRPSCAEQTDRLEPAVRLLATLPIPI